MGAMIGESEARRRHICVVATVPFAIRMFMRPHIASLGSSCDVTIVTSGNSGELTGLFGGNVRVVPVEIARKIALGKDLRALFELWRIFRRENFDVVHSIMPKAGTLAMLAARVAGVRIRLHTFTGQVWGTQTGPKALLLKTLDRLLASNATHLLADSHSQRRFLIANAITRPSAIEVLADGSIVGVDVERFAFNDAARRRIRSASGIPEDGVVFMYLGRLNRDKGVIDLMHAFAEIAVQDERPHLFIVGPDEDRIEERISQLTQRFPSRVHRAGYTLLPEEYLSCADVLCLPSYREGFPNVPLQAAAAGIPTLGSCICGITDAVEDGVTGVLHAPGSIAEIARGMTRLASDVSLRQRLGKAARRRVVAAFSETRLTAAFADYYRRILAEIETPQRQHATVVKPG